MTYGGHHCRAPAELWPEYGRRRMIIPDGGQGRRVTSIQHRIMCQRFVRRDRGRFTNTTIHDGRPRGNNLGNPLPPVPPWEHTIRCQMWGKWSPATVLRALCPFSSQTRGGEVTLPEHGRRRTLRMKNLTLPSGRYSPVYPFHGSFLRSFTGGFDAYPVPTADYVF